MINQLPDELAGDVMPGSGPRETFGYSLKRKLLGPPLVNEQMSEQRLSRPLALGVLSCDGISSAAYGTEEMLIELVPVVGLAAFTLILPMTLVILAGVALVVLSYREVVSVYTRAGGSYVVARENFGPRVAQVAAVALLIDYMVTVAVQVAAGSAAIVSAFPQLGEHPGHRLAHPDGHLGGRRADHVLRQPAGHPRGGALRSRCPLTCSPGRSG